MNQYILYCIPSDVMANLTSQYGADVWTHEPIELHSLQLGDTTTEYVAATEQDALTKAASLSGHVVAFKQQQFDGNLTDYWKATHIANYDGGFNWIPV